MIVFSLFPKLDILHSCFNRPWIIIIFWGGGGSAGPLVFAESLPTQVKFGSREWVLGRVEYDTRASDVPLSLILPLVIGPMVAVIAVSVYCYW